MMILSPIRARHMAELACDKARGAGLAHALFVMADGSRRVIPARGELFDTLARYCPRHLVGVYQPNSRPSEVLDDLRAHGLLGRVD